jgi:hypothetical protein
VRERVEPWLVAARGHDLSVVPHDENRRVDIVDRRFRSVLFRHSSHEVQEGFVAARQMIDVLDDRDGGDLAEEQRCWA